MRARFRTLIGTLLLLMGLLPAGLHAQSAAGAPVFEQHVLPIFSTYCFTCHGKSSPELGMDLRTAAIETGAHSSQAAGEIPEAARRQISRFEKEIQPVFNARCVACHSGDTPQSGLALTSLAAALKGGKHGPVIS